MSVTSEQLRKSCEARRDAPAYMRRQTCKGCLNEAEEIPRYLPLGQNKFTAVAGQNRQFQF